MNNFIYKLLGYEKTFDKGFNDGKEKGYNEGFNKGFKEGIKQGEINGLEKGKKIIIVNEPQIGKNIEDIKTRDKYIVSGNLFKIKNIEEKIKADLNKRIFNDKNIPTTDQWKVILTENPNTYVIAGAGSGKTTTLIYRILVMNQYLNIPLSNITIFSFTRKSTEEFRNKLRKVFDSIGITLKDSELKKTVRTFHSKIYQFAQSLGANNFFDYLGHDHDDKADIDFNIGLKLSDKQKEFLKGIYNETFKNNPKFRKVILSLYKTIILRPNSDDKKDYNDFAVQKTIEADKEITQKVQNYFTYNLNYDKLIEFKTHNLSNYKFLANLYYKELDLYIIFCPYDENLKQDIMSDDRSVADRLLIKKRFLNAKSDKNLRFINKQEDLYLLEEQITVLKNSMNDNSNAPNFSIKIEGEISEIPIFEAFYGTGNFVENLGLEVNNITDDIINQFSLIEQDKLFAKALIIFWKEFEKKIKNIKIYRLHDIFKYFSEDNIENFKYVDDIIESMQHVLIDEFQDISPEIVKWIKGCLKYLKNKFTNTSLLCVGDDWQSIYGWRGSNPGFLIDYKKYFPSNPEAKEITMTENFRCHQELIDKAEHVLKNVKLKKNKHGKSKLKKDFDEPILEIISIDSNEKEENKAIEIIGEKFKNTGEKLFVMSRTNEKYKEIQKNYKNKPNNIVFFTFHRSKGLESPHCLLIGDCYYNSENQFENLIYELAGMNQSYDESQRDEAMRLAYVALTRGVKKVFWIGEEKDGGALSKLKDLA